jgi:hypothetical protein
VRARAPGWARPRNRVPNPALSRPLRFGRDMAGILIWPSRLGRDAESTRYSARNSALNLTAQTRKSPARRIGTPIPDSRPNRDSGIPCFPAKSGIGDSLPDSRRPNRESGERELGISGSDTAKQTVAACPSSSLQMPRCQSGSGPAGRWEDTPPLCEGRGPGARAGAGELRVTQHTRPGHLQSAIPTRRPHPPGSGGGSPPLTAQASMVATMTMSLRPP